MTGALKLLPAFKTTTSLDTKLVVQISLNADSLTSTYSTKLLSTKANRPTPVPPTILPYGNTQRTTTLYYRHERLRFLVDEAINCALEAPPTQTMTTTSRPLKNPTRASRPRPTPTKAAVSSVKRRRKQSRYSRRNSMTESMLRAQCFIATRELDAEENKSTVCLLHGMSLWREWHAWRGGRGQNLKMCICFISFDHARPGVFCFRNRTQYPDQYRICFQDHEAVVTVWLVVAPIKDLKQHFWLHVSKEIRLLYQFGI